MRSLVLIAALVGCGGSENDEAFTCAQSDRSGTYVMHFEERPNGTCGPSPDEVTRLDGSGGLADGCSLDAADTWSADQCRLDRSVTCCGGGFCTHVTGFTQQRDAGGATISGVLTIQIQEIGASGTVLDGCISTYDVTATRE